MTVSGLVLQVRAIYIPYALNSCSQIQYYDFFQTIELEAEYIWKGPVNVLKLTYLLSKYLPYADVALLVCVWPLLTWRTYKMTALK